MRTKHILVAISLYALVLAFGLYLALSVASASAAAGR